MSTDRRYYGILERGEFGFDTAKMSWAHWLAAALAAVTGTIHLYLFVNQAFPPFLFAAAVFYGAILALLFNVYRRLLYVLGIPFTAGQIALWAAQGMPDMEIAMIDKPIQALLIVILVYLFFREDDLVARR